MGDFKDKVIVITGGATGIGAECCRLFCEAGAMVAMNYYPGERDEQASKELVDEIREKGGIIERYAADVSDEAAVNAMVDQILARFGHIDSLINNAMTGLRKTFDQITFEDFMHLMSVNCGGAFLMCKAVIPGMVEQGHGNVVMVSSSALINGGGGSVAYPSAKGAMEGLMSGLVNEYAKYGIRINTVRPSVVATPMNRARYDDEGWANYVNKMPMKRASTPEEQAKAIMFLADDEAAAFVNGHALNVDGARMYHIRP